MMLSKSDSLDVAAIEMCSITKRFGRVIANQAINFSVKAGEIHALLGENGAGKTTLMNMLCGLYEPDQGEIRVQDQLVRFRAPRDAIAAGIGMVHQHFMLVEPFTVAENIVLGQSGRGLIRESPKRLEARLEALANQYGLRIDPTAQIWQLSVGEQQRVEIFKALYRNAKVLILDEPTAVLTPQEAEDLMTTLRGLARQGTAIVFISHKLNEVMAVCDRVTVLRDGQAIGTVAIQDCTERKLAQMMVGREVNLARNRAIPSSKPAAPVLELKNLWVNGDRGLSALQGVNLVIYSGEILGIAGVDGNGQRELEEAIVGLRSPQRGEIRVEGKLAHIPSDRYAMGLLIEFSVAENLVLKDIQAPPFQRKGLLQHRYILKHATDLVQRFLIRTPSVKTRTGKLSGGNAQKVVFARELSRNHQVLLAAQPTRGLDVGATEFVRTQLLAQREAGTAVLLISTELDEILSLSDRIAVLYEGAIVDVIDAEAADLHDLGLLMAGKGETVAES